MLTLKIHHDIANARKSLVKLRDSLHDLKPAFEKIKKRQIKRWDQNFTGEGRFYGNWAALEESTVIDRRNKGYGPRPILVRGGSLLGWVNEHNQAGKVAAQSVHWEFQGVSGGAGGASAPFHSEGFYNVAAGRDVHPRKIWDLNEDDEKNAEDEMNRYIDRIIARYF